MCISKKIRPCVRKTNRPVTVTIDFETDSWLHYWSSCQLTDNYLSVQPPFFLTREKYQVFLYRFSVIFHSKTCESLHLICFIFSLCVHVRVRVWVWLCIITVWTNLHLRRQRLYFFGSTLSKTHKSIPLKVMLVNFLLNSLVQWNGIHSNYLANYRHETSVTKRKLR